MKNSPKTVLVSIKQSAFLFIKIFVAFIRTKNFYKTALLVVLSLCSSPGYSQGIDTANLFGLWHNRAEIVDRFNYPEIHGRLVRYKWKELEPSPGDFNWKDFDKYIFDRTIDSLPMILCVFTQENAPDWLFDLGVPKVTERDSLGNETGSYAPYYPDSLYKYYFKRMITQVRKRIQTYPYSVLQYIIGIQPCFGEEGDYIGYKGEVDKKYELSKEELNDLFEEFSLYYYNEYKNTDPRIRLFNNPSNNGKDQTAWLLENCPNGWLKMTRLGKVFQVNKEIDKKDWLLNTLNHKHRGEYVRAGTELSEKNLDAGWWKTNTPRNMFALMCYMIYWGMDWTQQLPDAVTNKFYEPAFIFFNKYAGQKDTAKSVTAMCALRDGLDAADKKRFPESTFGKATIDNKERYKKIAGQFSDRGALLEDVNAAMGNETDNLYAKGINDVGWRILPGNYERYLYQLDANETSTGYWNVDAPAEPNSIYGKYARGISTTDNKDALYFDIDSSFLGDAFFQRKAAVAIDITYLDKDTGSFSAYYDSKDRANKPALTVKCNNTNTWKKVSFITRHASFRNNAPHDSGFYIKSQSKASVIFSVIELVKAGFDTSRTGFSAAPVFFDTICYTSVSKSQSTKLKGIFLDGSDVKVGPAAGFRFAERNEDDAFEDSIIIRNYGSNFGQTIYIIFKPVAPGNYNNIPVTGGGVEMFSIPVSAVALNSKPHLSANITDISCNKAKDGAIDLIPENGEGPFSYQWSSSEKTLKQKTEDIDSLTPADYTVVVTSKAGCETSKTFTVAQPDDLVASVKADSDIVCKGGTTTVTVDATGGTAPYQGIGNFSIGWGYKSFQVKDKNGCTDNASITLENGTKTAPPKPSFIEGTDADATGVCGNNEFTYTVSKVPDATSYTWSLPANTTISSIQNNGEILKLIPSSSFVDGPLGVNAFNICGTSNELTKYIKKDPGKPDSITGLTKVKAQQQGLVYKVQPVIEGVQYVWEVTNGAVITGGQNTSKITVNWGKANGKVKALAKNDCGSSPFYILNVTIASSVSDIQNFIAEKNASEPAIIVRLQPNPAKAYVYLTIHGRGRYLIELSDVTGKVLLRKTTGFVTGYNQEYIDLQYYAAGAYLIHITDKDRYSKTIKLLKE